MKNQIVRQSPYLLYLLAIPICASIYEQLNKRTFHAIDLSTPLDHRIPFLPVFILPYGVWYEYLFFFLIYLCFKNTKVYIKTVSLIVIAEFICFIIFYFFQTTVPRPVVDGKALLDRFVLMVYAYDRPYNCFPSIHVLTCLAVMLGAAHIKNKHKVITACIYGIGFLIILSTLFVKQHVILDLIGSSILVSFLYGVLFEHDSLRVPKKSEALYLKNES